jgi:hypothetical protein
MPGRSIRIARIAGIPVGVSPLWLIVVGLITWSLGAGYYPGEVRGITPAASYALGLASALLLSRASWRTSSGTPWSPAGAG